jgi:hypothetical protein
VVPLTRPGTTIPAGGGTAPTEDAVMLLGLEVTV